MTERLNLLKNVNCWFKSLLSIMILSFVMVIVMLLIFYGNTQNHPKLVNNRNLQIVSESKQLRILRLILLSNTKGHDHYNNINDNSNQGKFNNHNIQKLISPVHVKKEKKIDFYNKSVDIQTNKSADPEINATHIKGLLMESIHVNYTRNIYFSVKTTHNNFVKRLFPLMLTWLQLVDKNKVRQC